MVHRLVEQLRFARSEFRRSLAGITAAEAERRFGPINSLGWMVGHLAAQEERYWLTRRAGIVVVPGLQGAVGYGAPASTPPLADMWTAWERITAVADPYLDTLATPDLSTFYQVDGRPHDESVGTMLQRVTYHYWFHNGEAQAVRQLLGHAGLPEFVGEIGEEAPYRPEAIERVAPV